MARTASDLDLKEVVYLDENGTHTPYFCVAFIDDIPILHRHYCVAAKRMHSSNVAHYDNCEMDAYLTSASGFLARFDEPTQDSFEAVAIKVADYTIDPNNAVEYVELARSVFLPTYGHYGFRSDALEGTSWLDTLKSYAGTTNANTARICRNSSETAVICWFSSGFGSTQFRLVHTNGAEGNGTAANASIWFRPALGVSPDTPISERSEESTFLLPVGRRTYWNIGAIAHLGESVDRPKKARLIISESGVSQSEYKVSNNVGDTTPTWVATDADGIATLDNTTKETTNWELGVKIDARGGTADIKVGEPVLLVETEESE